MTEERKKCSLCGKEKTLNEFYLNSHTGKYTSRCKVCQRRLSTDYENTKRDPENFVNRVNTQPRQFFDERQKEQVFEFLQLLGWTYNEEKDIWIKKGIVDENGVWQGIEKYNKKMQLRNKETIRKDSIQKEKRKYEISSTIIDKKKYCKMCGEFRPIEEFHFNKFNNSYYTLCNFHHNQVCNERNKAKRQNIIDWKDKEQLKLYRKLWKLQNKPKNK